VVNYTTVDFSLDIYGNVETNGNLLQNAVAESKKDFVRMLLEFGADPNANTEEKERTPMELAVKMDNFEVLVTLAAFAEVPPELKPDFLSMILENEGDEQYAAEFKKNLEGLSVSEVLEKQLSWSWHLKPDDTIYVNMVQFAAGKGKTDLLQLLLDHGLDPEAHEEDSPRAVELAAVHGHGETFAALTAHLNLDNEWLQLAQVLVWGMSGDGANHCHDWKQSEEFKQLLQSLPPAKVSKESVCGSTLLQDFARCGNRSAVAALLQHGANPAATTPKNPKLPERWAYEHNHVGVLVELAKVKEVEPEIMWSSLGELVRELMQKEEERDWRMRKEEEEREWRRKMLEQCTSAVQQQQDWQKEVVGMLQQLLPRKSSEAE